MNKSKSVFLDRDGVINKNKDDYVKNISELEIFPFISEPIKKFQSAEFKIIVITNQSAIGRKLITNILRTGDNKNESISNIIR